MAREICVEEEGETEADTAIIMPSGDPG